MRAEMRNLNLRNEGGAAGDAGGDEAFRVDEDTVQGCSTSLPRSTHLIHTPTLAYTPPTRTGPDQNSHPPRSPLTRKHKPSPSLARALPAHILPSSTNPIPLPALSLPAHLLCSITNPRPCPALSLCAQFLPSVRNPCPLLTCSPAPGCSPKPRRTDAQKEYVDLPEERRTDTQKAHLQHQLPDSASHRLPERAALRFRTATPPRSWTSNSPKPLRTKTLRHPCGWPLPFEPSEPTAPSCDRLR